MAKSLGVGMIKGVLITIILVVILFQMLNDTAADVNAAAGNLTATGGVADSTYPLMNFFKKKGVLLLAFIAGIVLVVITSVLGSNK